MARASNLTYHYVGAKRDPKTELMTVDVDRVALRVCMAMGGASCRAFVAQRPHLVQHFKSIYLTEPQIPE